MNLEKVVKKITKSESHLEFNVEYSKDWIKIYSEIGINNVTSEDDSVIVMFVFNKNFGLISFVVNEVKSLTIENLTLVNEYNNKTAFYRAYINNYNDNKFTLDFEVEITFNSVDSSKMMANILLDYYYEFFDDENLDRVKRLMEITHIPGDNK